MKLIYLIIGLSSFVFVSCRSKTVKTVNQQQEQVLYTCPMHPEIIRNAPGSCPICGMDLVKLETDSEAVKDVELDALLRPANAFVISSIPMVTLEQRQEEIEMKVVGRVAYDTRQAGIISSRIPGRIERLYIRYKYQPVQKGQRVMDVYSPELLTAQQNLIFLLKNDPDNTSLIAAAKDRLILLGMPGNQVTRIMETRSPVYSVPVFSNYTGFVTDLVERPLENMQQPDLSVNQELRIKEGMYVKPGEAVFSVYNPGRAWVLLDIFPEQQSHIGVGSAVKIIPETAPHQVFNARIDYVEPVFRPGNKTLTARVNINNASLKLPIGSRVTASIFTKSKIAFWLPKEAVLSLGRDHIVFKKEEGGFRARKVSTGMELNEYIQVTAGLGPSDSVAANARFLVDNEAFIKAK